MNPLVICNNEFSFTNKGGEIHFIVDEDCINIGEISVTDKRRGIGTRLVKKVEKLARQKNIERIDVPVSPRKEALLFWEQLNYQCAFDEDIPVKNEILQSNDDTALWDTDSGVVVMTKHLNQ